MLLILAVELKSLINSYNVYGLSTRNIEYISCLNEYITAYKNHHSFISVPSPLDAYAADGVRMMHEKQLTSLVQFKYVNNHHTILQKIRFIQEKYVSPCQIQILTKKPDYITHELPRIKRVDYIFINELSWLKIDNQQISWFDKPLIEKSLNYHKKIVNQSIADSVSKKQKLYLDNIRLNNFKTDINEIFRKENELLRKNYIKWKSEN